MPPPVATHKHASTSPCRRSARTLAALGLVTATALGVMPAGTGSAAPKPSIQDVEQRVAQLDLQADQAVEDYQEAQVELVALRRTSETAQADVQRQQAVLSDLQRQVGDVVASAYRSGDGGSTLSLITDSSSPQAYLERATSLDQLAAQQADRVVDTTAARVRLETVVQRAAADLAAQRAVEARAAERKKTVEDTLSEQKALLASLKEQERRRVLAERAAQLLAQQQAAARASRARQAATAAAPAEQPSTGASASSGGLSSGSSTPAHVSTPALASSGSGRASVAVREAYAKLGSPYVWGASGPSTFDCSGLTSWVWAKAGVSLPHSSRAQYAVGRQVSQSEIAPGDLVFYGSPIHHVGIYVGGGNMISAPHTGDVVKVQPAFRSDYVGATRP